MHYFYGRGGLLLEYFYAAYHNKLWDWGLYWYPFILITPGLCIVLYWIGRALRKIHLNCIVRLLNVVGTHTLYVYLLHIFAFDVRAHLVSAGLVAKGGLTTCITILLVIPATLAFVWIEKGTGCLMKGLLAKRKEHK